MKKLLAFFLLLALLTAMLAACNPGDDTSNTASNDTSGDASEESTGPVVYKADIPDDVNYEGKKFKILTTSFSSSFEFTEFGYGDELKESAINTAVFERNNKVNEMLGIEIVEELVVDTQRFVGGEINERVKKALATSSDDFYLVVPSLYNCGELASYGAFYNLYEFEYLHNLSEPWWDQSFNEELSIDGKLYFITGDIGIATRNSITVCFFNKDLFANNGLGDPYEMVRNHEWTFDKLIEISKTVSLDLNMDDRIDHRDRFGVGGQNDLAWAMFYGSGERIASKDADQMPTLTMYNARSAKVMDKMLELMTNDSYFVNANFLWDYSDTPSVLIADAFIAGNCLVYCEALGAVEHLREMTQSDFGILPIPLYDTEQQEYQHMINPWSGNAIAIPAYLPQEDAIMASIVLEALGAESKNYITPAYYDIALKQQKARDEESAEMLDIIFSNVGCDMGHIYSWGDLGQHVLHASVEDKLVGKFQSTYETYKAAAEAEMQSTIDAFNEHNY